MGLFFHVGVVRVLFRASLYTLVLLVYVLIGSSLVYCESSL